MPEIEDAEVLDETDDSAAAEVAETEDVPQVAGVDAIEDDETEEDEIEEDNGGFLAEETRTAQDAEPCGHPHANGICWFSRIAEPCGFACKWLIDRGQDAGR